MGHATAGVRREMLVATRKLNPHKTHKISMTNGTNNVFTKIVSTKIVTVAAAVPKSSPRSAGVARSSRQPRRKRRIATQSIATKTARPTMPVMTAMKSSPPSAEYDTPPSVGSANP